MRHTDPAPRSRGRAQPAADLADRLPVGQAFRWWRHWVPQAVDCLEHRTIAPESESYRPPIPGIPARDQGAPACQSARAP